MRAPMWPRSSAAMLSLPSPRLLAGRPQGRARLAKDNIGVGRRALRAASAGCGRGPRGQAAAQPPHGLARRAEAVHSQVRVLPAAARRAVLAAIAEVGADRPEEERVA